MAAPSNDKRREVRYRARLPVRLIRGKEVTTLQTDDVSFRGVFLRMDAPPQLRQLVRLEVTLPDGATIKAHAMVVYRMDPGGEQAPGAGMQFYGLEGRERAQWEAFVHKVREQTPKSGTPGTPLEFVPPGTPDPVRRRFERHDVRFEVRLTSLDELVALYTRDISHGGMAIATELDLDPGVPVKVEIVHPQTLAVFELDAVVRRKIREGDARGLGVEFVELSEGRRKDLTRFIGTALPREDTPTVNVGDPKLA